MPWPRTREVLILIPVVSHTAAHKGTNRLKPKSIFFPKTIKEPVTSYTRRAFNEIGPLSELEILLTKLSNVSEKRNKGVKSGILV